MDINKNFDNDTFNFMKNKSQPNLPVNELIDLPIFYINLDSSQDQFESFNNQIKKYNINPNQVTRIVELMKKYWTYLQLNSRFIKMMVKIIHQLLPACLVILKP